MKSVVAGVFFCLFGFAALAQAPSELLSRVGIEPRIGASAPLDLTFRDENGDAVPLARYFGARPVVLVMAYYSCPQLCPLVLNGLADALAKGGFIPGEVLEVVAVSIDPRDTPAVAAQKKAAFLARLQQPQAGPGVHFLSGDAKAITRLAEAVGFRYFYARESDQYAHAAGLTLLTPQGKIARYFYGLEPAAGALRSALADARAERVGSPVEQLLLLCFHYDPLTGRYSGLIVDSLRILAVASAIALAAFIGLKLRGERVKE